ncbi:MAG: hypothetical protein H7Y37_16350 [Anaerolineae bacterium]|nr:hypothetical protein [Gloeobacterales cyanobacterium ES-bin-313]
MNKFLPSLIASILVTASPSYAAEERLPITIVNFMTNTAMQGSLTVRLDESVNLYNESGELLEQLLFANKVRYGRRELETRSAYSGDKYVVIIDNYEPGLSSATLKETPKPDLEAARNAPRLSKKEWIDNLTWKVQESFRKGDQLGYESALKALKKARALPDDPK